jgi:hypothetical protein
LCWSGIEIDTREAGVYFFEVLLATRRAPARKLNALRDGVLEGERWPARALPALAGRLPLAVRSAENALSEPRAGFVVCPAVCFPVSSPPSAFFRGLTAFLPSAAWRLGVCGSLALRLGVEAIGGAMPAASAYNPFLPGR